MTKHPRWDHKEDYGFQNEIRFEVWAWEMLKRYDAYRTDYQKFVAEKAEFGEDESDWKITITNNRPKYVHGFEPPKYPDESDKAWQMRCDEQGVVARFLSLSSLYGLKWGLVKMCPPDMLYDEGVAFTDQRRFPRLIERYDELEIIPSINLEIEGRDESFVHPQSGVVHFNLLLPLPPQIEEARKRLEQRVEAYNLLPGITFGDSKDRWLIHYRVKDAIDLDPNVDRYGLAKNIVGERDTPEATSKAGYDLIRQATKFFTRSKHLSILLGVRRDESSEIGI